MSIAGARRSLFVTNAYFAPDQSFMELVVDAARRGVNVRILVGGASTDVALTRLAARHRYDALLSAGARVYEYADIHAARQDIRHRWMLVEHRYDELRQPFAFPER